MYTNNTALNVYYLLKTTINRHKHGFTPACMYSPWGSDTTFQVLKAVFMYLKSPAIIGRGHS